MHTRMVWMQEFKHAKALHKAQVLSLPQGQGLPCTETSQAPNLLYPCLIRKEMVISQYNLSKNYSLRKAHSVWCSQGTHKHVPVLGWKKSNPLFLNLRKAFLRLTGEREATQKLDPESINIYHWNSWMRHKTPDIAPHAKDSCYASDVIHLCTSDESLVSSYFPLTH